MRVKTNFDSARYSWILGSRAAGMVVAIASFLALGSSFLLPSFLNEPSRNTTR